MAPASATTMDPRSASGAAGPLQEQDDRRAQQGSTLPVLLRIPFSTYCRKTEWGLAHAGIAYEAVDVLPKGMRNIRRANPWERTVPVLRHGPHVIAGSHDILAWAHNERPEAGLFPSGADGDESRTRVAAWESWADDELGPLLRRQAYRELRQGVRPWARNPIQLLGLWLLKSQFKIPYRYYRIPEHDDADAVALPAALQRTVDGLRTAEAAGHPYLVGDRPTAADCAIAAFWEPLMPVAARAGYVEHEGWDLIERHVRATRPRRAQRTLVRRRRIREKDWAGFEAAATAQGRPYRVEMA